MDNDTTVSHPVLKALSAWIAAVLSHVGMNSWSDVAAFLAALYTMGLMLELIWKVFFKGARK